MRLERKRRAAILLCSVAFAVLAVPAMAKPNQRHTQHPQAVVQPQNDRSPDAQPYPFASVQTADGAATKGHRRAAKTHGRRAAQAHANSAFGGFTSNSLVSEARKYIGTNPTGRGSLWCGAFMDLVLKRTGHTGGGNLASAYAHYGTRVSGPEVGAIAVMGRRGGGHVGVVTGIDPNGNPIIVSGNHNRTVAESVYRRGRITAYVMPGG